MTQLKERKLHSPLNAAADIAGIRVAEELGVPFRAIETWFRLAKLARTKASDLRDSTLNAENEQLRVKIRQAEADREILRRALASSELRSKHRHVETKLLPDEEAARRDSSLSQIEQG